MADRKNFFIDDDSDDSFMDLEPSKYQSGTREQALQAQGFDTSDPVRLRAQLAEDFRRRGQPPIPPIPPPVDGYS